MSLVELDVPALEESLKTFMRGQAQFRDYDWEGSNASALIRLLAYNTWKNSWYLHMVMSEGFLDSAQTRNSVLSHAKELNYSPRSSRSAKARISIEFDGTEPTYVIEKGRTFSSIIRNRGLVFSVPETMILTSSNGHYKVETDLYEGRYVQDSYVMDSSSETQRFFLTNPGIDARSLNVVIYEDGQIEGQVYSRATTLLGVTSKSKVFFLQASEFGQYEVIFGDGVIGHRPPDGSTIILDYRITLGQDGNGARIFNRDFNIGEGATNVRVETISQSENGAAPESLESIRYYAPRHFQIQERAVTAQDYAILLKMAFPEIRAVSAYGGEESNSPQYGKVIVAVDLVDVDGIPESKADEYRRFLKERAGLTIEPVIVEPSFTYLSIRAQVLYNINLTTLSPQSIQTLVTQQILEYADEYLNDFGSIIRYSRLVGLIDDSHRSVIGNQTSMEVYKKVPVERGATHTFELDFSMPLLRPDPSERIPTRTIQSSSFRSSSEVRYLVDDSRGNIFVATERGNSRVLISRVGTVDYETGKVRVANLLIDRIDENDLKIYARPRSMDVVTQGDTILGVEADEIRVSVRAGRE